MCIRDRDYTPRHLDDSEIDRICADPRTYNGSLVNEETYSHPKFTTAEEQE